MAPISIKTVLISESVDPCCKSILEENGIRVTEKQNMKKDELIAEIKVRRWLPKSFLAKVKRLKVQLASRFSARAVFKHSGGARLRAHFRMVHGISRSLLRISAAWKCEYRSERRPLLMQRIHSFSAAACQQPHARQPGEHVSGHE